MEQVVIVSSRGAMKNKIIQKGKELEKKLNIIAPELYMRVYNDFIIYGEVNEQKIVEDFIQGR